VRKLAPEMLLQDPHQLLARELRETQLQLAQDVARLLNITRGDLWMVIPQ
jgi:hypothetical protein